MIWTERSDYGARQLARERRLNIVQALDISHEQLLRLLGREAPPPKRPAPEKDPAVNVESAEVVETPAPQAPAGSSLSMPVRYHFEDESDASADDDTLIIPGASSPPVKNVFFSDGPLSDSIVPPEDRDSTQPPLPPQPPKRG